MMKSLWFGLGLMMLGMGASFAQTPVAPCVTITSTQNGPTQVSCQPVTAANPLPVTSSGGSGGAVTLASGAVASGAYSAGAFVSGSFLSGALADGAIATLGTEGDTAWSSGSGTVISILKKISGNTGAAAAGNVSNATSAVATSATNIGAVAWLYGFNGATWDQLLDNTHGALTIDDVTTNNQLHTDLTAPIAAQSNHTTNIGAVDSISPYPATAVPITASATGTTGATTATLTNVSGHTTYICWYSVRANATAATTVTDTITGIISGTRSSALWVAPLASGLGVDEMIFSPCVPASAVSTSIAVVSGAPGSGGTVTVSAGGYSL